MAADRIRIAEPAPPHCSACFQSKPRMVHVDFGAAWDGPVLEVEGNGVVPHVIDDLIICLQCLQNAGSLEGVDLGDVTKLKAELANAEAENDQLMEEKRGLKAYIATLEAVRDSRPNELLDGPKPKQRPRRQKAAA